MTDEYHSQEGNGQGAGMTGDHKIQDDGTNEAFLNGEKCVVFNPDADRFEVKTTCPPALGICKCKLVDDNYEPIENNVVYDILSSESNPIPTDFDGQGTNHIELLDNSGEKFVDMKLSDQILLTAIRFEMPNDKAIKRFKLFIGEAGIQNPNILTPWDIHDLHYGNWSTTPRVVQRMAYFQPIIADRIKIVIEDGSATILTKIELLGMPFEKVYKSNPVFEQIPLRTGNACTDFAE